MTIHSTAAALLGDVSALRARYETELFERVLPFWERHSPDRVHGGYFNNLDRDGSVYDTDKHVWLQGRQVWLFSKLYRTVEQRPEWLELARLGMDFLRAHALRPDGRVYFALAQNGDPVKLQRKVFGECFYVMALAEYARAADETTLAQEARTMLARLWTWAFDWSHVGADAMAGAPDQQMLAVPMILLNLIDEVAGDDWPSYRVEIDECLRRVRLHVDHERQIVREHVAPDGGVLPGPTGRLLNPGHVIEAGWFVHVWAERLGDRELAQTARDMIRWSHDGGWDATHGGLYYFLDADGHSPTQLEWSMKLWWPHCEALYGHLVNAATYGEQQDADRFLQTDAYTFAHFPDREFGEWYGYLDRQGSVTHRFKGGPYKGAFHVPRALLLCWQLLGRIEQAS
jgi:N-acylglucosamine 2-epimerase